MQYVILLAFRRGGHIIGCGVKRLVAAKQMVECALFGGSAFFGCFMMKEFLQVARDITPQHRACECGDETEKYERIFFVLVHSLACNVPAQLTSPPPTSLSAFCASRAAMHSCQL